YAFPLWHGWLALVAQVAQVDPASVVLHEPSILTPLALVLAYEAGRSVFRSTWLGLAAMAAQVAVIAFAPGNGGAYTSLELPGTGAQLKHSAGDLVVHSPSSFHLGAGLVARTGSIAIAGLMLVPLAVLAGRRRWSAFVLGGSVLVLVLELWSLVFPHFSDFVS